MALPEERAGPRLDDATETAGDTPPTREEVAADTVSDGDRSRGGMIGGKGAQMGSFRIVNEILACLRAKQTARAQRADSQGQVNISSDPWTPDLGIQRAIMSLVIV